MLVNSAVVSSTNFTGVTNVEVSALLSIPVLAGDVVTLQVRNRANRAGRPCWSSIRGIVTVSNAIMWTFDDTYGDGRYCLEGVI